MYEFLDRFVTVALPRVRDFRGVSGRAFDGRGNYNIGVKEQIIFPEIEYDKIDALRGLNISITTTAKTDDEAKALLAASSSRSETEVTVAKLALIEREKKRARLAAKYAPKRAAAEGDHRRREQVGRRALCRSSGAATTAAQLEPDSQA